MPNTPDYVEIKGTAIEGTRNLDPFDNQIAILGRLGTLNEKIQSEIKESEGWFTSKEEVEAGVEIFLKEAEQAIEEILNQDENGAVFLIDSLIELLHSENDLFAKTPAEIQAALGKALSEKVIAQKEGKSSGSSAGASPGKAVKTYNEMLRAVWNEVGGGGGN